MSSAPSETRLRILDATRRLLERSAGKGVRMVDVARAAGVSRQTVYLNFGSRSALLIATARHVDESERFLERTQVVRDAGSGSEALEAFATFWAGYLPAIHGVARALLAARDHDGDAAAAWDDRMADLRRVCGFLIGRLRSDGTLAPEWSRAEEATDLLWALISVQNWEALTGGRGWSQRRYEAVLKRVLRRTFIGP